jgi:aspartokinase-like uncharacterized kinase
MNASVIKVGGSLLSHPKKLRVLCRELSGVSKKHKLIVVPGGGEFADVVRVLDKRFSLSNSTSHMMAVLAMDQYGLMLSNLIPNSHAINKIEEVNCFLDKEKVPIFLPSNLFLSEDPLENSWDVTSDSIAVYLAHRMQVHKVLLVTDVDGVFTDDPKTNPDATLIKKLSVNELLSMDKRTGLDKPLPKLLSKFTVDCFVINGLYPDRVEKVLNGQREVYTLITSDLF